jgi:hypothetical protein
MVEAGLMNAEAEIKDIKKTFLAHHLLSVERDATA